MRKIILLSLFALLAVNLSGAWNTAETKKFIREMNKASDPDSIGSSIKTLEVDGESIILGLNVKMQVKSYFKIPSKLRQSINVAGLQNTVIYFDGKKGFKVDSLAGVTPLEGQILAETAVGAKLSNPALTIDKVFDKVEIADKPELFRGGKYIAVTGSFEPSKKIAPYKMLVDPKTKRIIYLFCKTATEMGVIDAITHNIEFKKINGLVIPSRSVQEVLTMKVETVIKSVKVNKNIPDSFFEYKE